MNIIRIYRRRIAFIIAYVILSCAVLYLVSNDEQFYTNTVAKILTVSESKETEENPSESGTYVQNITAEILNGEHQGDTVSIQNMYSKALVVDEKYGKGNKIIISLDDSGKKLAGKIISLKRDTVIAFMILILVFVVLFFIKLKGILTLLSVAVNMLLLYGSLGKLNQGKYTILFSVILMILFMVVSLTLLGGFHRDTAATIASSFITTVVTAAIYLIVLKIAGEPEYLMMDYVEYLPNSQIVPQLFFAEIMIGSLGAIMDVSISITTTVDELVRYNPDISVGSLYMAVKQVGHDIMGTMVNVLFFSYFCGTVPMILMKMQNHYEFSEIFRYHLPFEVIRFLTGSIGIILSIPISSLFAIWFLAKRRDKA